jgi:outer membrane protein OmpA-like peptidoglycan-associated protein
MAEEHKEAHGGGGGEHGGGDAHGKGSHGGGGHGPGGHGGGGHGEEGAPEWLISFADNVALLMGFFVILLAMNMAPKGGGSTEGEGAGAPAVQSDEMLDFIISIREGFNNPVNPNSGKPEEAALAKRLREKQGGLSKSEGPTGNHPSQQAPRPSDYDRVTALISFDQKSALVSPSARQTIAEVSQKQKDQRFIIEVRGHAAPFETMRDPGRAYQLSYERAMAVAKALVETGMTWPSIRVVACGDADRVVGRTFDKEQDRNNQRVEIVVTNYPVPEDPYSQAE